jgi:hypothetical protein
MNKSKIPYYHSSIFDFRIGDIVIAFDRIACITGLSLNSMNEACLVLKYATHELEEEEFCVVHPIHVNHFYSE